VRYYKPILARGKNVGEMLCMAAEQKYVDFLVLGRRGMNRHEPGPLLEQEVVRFSFLRRAWLQVFEDSHWLHLQVLHGACPVQHYRHQRHVLGHRQSTCSVARTNNVTLRVLYA